MFSLLCSCHLIDLYSGTTTQKQKMSLYTLTFDTVKPVDCDRSLTPALDNSLSVKVCGNFDSNFFIKTKLKTLT